MTTLCDWFQGYNPTLFYPKKPNKPLFDNLTKQCQGMELPFLSEFPTDVEVIQSSYSLVVDALFGFSFQPPVRPLFAGVIDTLKKVETPICSVDVPSGNNPGKLHCYIHNLLMFTPIDINPHPSWHHNVLFGHLPMLSNITLWHKSFL